MGKRQNISLEALIVGYALSRLGLRLLKSLGWSSWMAAYADIGQTLHEKHKSIKGLRDEFDVFFPNGRRGWHGRKPLERRLAVTREFESVSDEALIEVVRGILGRDMQAIEEIVELLQQVPERVSGVAERLMTGRMAEEYVMAHSDAILQTPSVQLIDMRHRACGYDFEAASLAGVALEVKGLKEASGGVLFTDREWSEAAHRRSDYWLILVGQLSTPEPVAKVFRDPTQLFEARCDVVKSTAATWRFTASV